MTLDNDPQAPRVLLTLNTLSPQTARSIAQIDAHWMFFEATSTLTPADFITARLGTLPQHLSVQGAKCNCGHLFINPQDDIDHALKCDMASHITHTVRHNMVRDAIVGVTRAYGITTSKEPTAFTYADGRKHRPDILCHTAPYALVTDVSLIADEYSLEEAEAKKQKAHTDPCAKLHAIFVPFVMHTKGTLGTKAERFIKDLMKAIPPCQTNSFNRDIHHAVATAAARGRSQTIQAVAARIRW